MEEMKQCKAECKKQKPLSEFRYRLRKNGRYYYESYCKDCERERNKKRLKKRYQECKQDYKDWYKEHKEEKLEYEKEYRTKNREQINIKARERNKNNREYIYKWRKNKYDNDPSFKLRLQMSSAINNRLKKNSGSKCGQSMLDYLPYTIEELRQHLESQFESWMTWGNWGMYDTNVWKDEVKSTWTWQIDHIIPASEYKYKSMEDEAFIQCWALNNLRPLSAKKNVTEGSSRVRHKI